MNWVYDGNAVYVGAAGHCTTGVGQEVDLATMSLGSPIERIGQVAYVSQTLDFCLIKLDSAVLGQVQAGMAGHPAAPTGAAKIGRASCRERGESVVGARALKTT